MKFIDHIQAVEILRDIVKDLPQDYSYYDRVHEIDPTTESMPNEDIPCQYRWGEKPACIVGQVFDRLGIEVDEAWEGRTAISLDWELERLGTVRFTYRALDVLRAAQLYQDRGASWVSAVDGARRTAEEL